MAQNCYLFTYNISSTAKFGNWKGPNSMRQHPLENPKDVIFYV